MKVLALITEYNPFHFGHKHHLDLSNKEIDASHTMAIMSGSFVQRGEPSFVDKWTKAKIAIDSGVDLVIELPFVYSCQSAELFALGAVKILESTNIVDYISFGSEAGHLNPLEKISQVLVHESEMFKTSLRYHLDQGMSYSASRSKAVEKVLGDSSSAHILKNSNNILGIEYLKALKALNSRVKPYTIQRLGHYYNDKIISHKLASATGIRHKIRTEGIASIKNLVPEATYRHLFNYHKLYKNFNYLENYSHVMDYLLITKTKDSLKKIQDMEAGLENRLIKMNKSATDLNDLVEKVSSKRYTKTRIQRILIHLLMGLDSSTIYTLYKEPNRYIRVLGSNKKGFELLRKIKENSNLHIINKFADIKYLEDESTNLILDYEKMATDLYYFGTNNKKYNMDYLITPYIK